VRLQVGAESRANRGRVGLWHADISANGIRLREGKELLRCAAVPRIDQRARIHAAFGYDAAEGCVNMLEGFQFLEPAHVGFRGFYVGDFGFQIPDGVIDLLLGDAVGLDEFLVTRCGDLGEVRVGLRGIEFGARLRQLLIHFRSVDVREQFALPHAAADVVIPLFQIAVGARIDGRFDVGLHGAGEDEGPPGPIPPRHESRPRWESRVFPFPWRAPDTGRGAGTASLLRGPPAQSR